MASYDLSNEQVELIIAALDHRIDHPPESVTVRELNMVIDTMCDLTRYPERN